MKTVTVQIFSNENQDMDSINKTIKAALDSGVNSGQIIGYVSYTANILSVSLQSPSRQ